MIFKSTFKTVERVVWRSEELPFIHKGSVKYSTGDFLGKAVPTNHVSSKFLVMCLS